MLFVNLRIDIQIKIKVIDRNVDTNYLIALYKSVVNNERIGQENHQNIFLFKGQVGSRFGCQELFQM